MLRQKARFPAGAHTFSVPGVLFAVGIFFLCIFRVFCALFSATSALSFLLQANIDSLYNEKHDHGRHDGTSSIADERKCHSGQRNELGTAANGQEYLENIHNTDAVYDQ